MNAIAIIGSIVGVISCVIGISTFVSAQLTKAKQDGVLIAKIDQCVNGIDELKSNIKEKNHEYDSIIDEHTRAITQLQTEVKSLFKQLNMK